MPHAARRRIAREREPAACAPLHPSPVLDGTPVGTGAGHMSILAFPTHIVLGAVRRAQGVCSRAAGGLLACAVLSSSSARAVRSSCAGVDVWSFSCVVVPGCVCASCVEPGGGPGRIRCVPRKLRMVVCGTSCVAVVQAIAIARRAQVHSRAGRSPACVRGGYACRTGQVGLVLSF